MLVPLDDQRVLFASRHSHRADFPGQAAVLLCCGRFSLAPQGETVLILAADRKLFGQILGRLRHRLRAVSLFQLLVDEAPAHGRVIHLRRPAEGAFRLADDEGCARHALDAAGNHELALPRLDRLGADPYGIQSRAAQPVDCAARNFLGNASQKAAHAGNIAVILARLVCASEHHVIQRGPVDIGMALH